MDLIAKRGIWSYCRMLCPEARSVVEEVIRAVLVSNTCITGPIVQAIVALTVRNVAASFIAGAFRFLEAFIAYIRNALPSDTRMGIIKD